MAYRKLNRASGNRKALFRSLSLSSALILNGRIETTIAKAKETSKNVAKLITLAKVGDLHARRQALAILVDETATTKLFDELAPKYKERQGGFTRIYRVGPRRATASRHRQIKRRHCPNGQRRLFPMPTGLTLLTIPKITLTFAVQDIIIK